MPASVKQLRDNQNNFIYPKIAKEGLVEPIYGSDVTISTIDGLNSSDVQGALNELVTNLGNIDSVLDNVEIVKTASESVISVSDSADYRLLGLKLYGKSVQDGTPTPEAPVEIESAGDGGDITTYVFGKNLIDPMDGNTWTSSGEATFEILGDGKIKVTGEMSYSNVLCVFPQNILNLIKGRTCVFSTVIDSKSVETARVSGQITVTTASARKFYSNPGTPFVIDPDATKIQFGLYANNSGTTLETPNTVVFSDIGLYLGDTSQPWDTYEPIQTLTYPAPNGLPGIPVESGGNYTDADGQQWYCDIVDFAAGTHTKYVDYVDLKNYTFTLNPAWTNQNDTLAFAFSRVNLNKKIVGTLSNKLVYTTWKNTSSLYSEYQITVENTGINETVIYVTLPKTEFPGELNTSAFNNYLSTAGIYALVPLETPIETNLTPEQLAAYAALTTYKPNTTITTDSDPAVGMEVRYLTNNGLAEVLEKYATQAWVEGKGYLTAVPDGYVTSADVAATYAKKALKFTATFTSSGWTSATGGFSQAVNVAGLTADDEPIIDLNSTATDADTFNGQLEAFGLVSNFQTGDGTLTAVVLGDSAPTVDIPIHGVVAY